MQAGHCGTCIAVLSCSTYVVYCPHMGAAGFVIPVHGLRFATCIVLVHSYFSEGSNSKPVWCKMLFLVELLQPASLCNQPLATRLRASSVLRSGFQTQWMHSLGVALTALNLQNDSFYRGNSSRKVTSKLIPVCRNREIVLVGGPCQSTLCATFP